MRSVIEMIAISCLNQKHTEPNPLLLRVWLNRLVCYLGLSGSDFNQLSFTIA